MRAPCGMLPLAHAPRLGLAAVPAIGTAGPSTGGATGTRTATFGDRSMSLNLKRDSQSCVLSTPGSQATEPSQERGSHFRRLMPTTIRAVVPRLLLHCSYVLRVTRRTHVKGAPARSRTPQGMHKGTSRSKLLKDVARISDLS